jgi:predicted nucleic acid-binding protein
VTLFVFLDAGPLGLVTNPRESDETREAALWLRSMSLHGARVVLPEIADYEVRRELIRASKRAGIRRLDALKATAEYVPITTDAMLRAAGFWAAARRRGRPSAPAESLDADVILAAQAVTYAVAADDRLTVATTNVRHLELFVDARHWRDISPDT